MGWQQQIRPHFWDLKRRLSSFANIEYLYFFLMYLAIYTNISSIIFCHLWGTLDYFQIHGSIKRTVQSRIRPVVPESTLTTGEFGVHEYSTLDMIAAGSIFKDEIILGTGIRFSSNFYRKEHLKVLSRLFKLQAHRQGVV